MFAFFCVMRYNYKNTKGGELFEKREKRTYRGRKAGTKGKYSGLAVYDIFCCRFYSGICILRYAHLAIWRWLTHIKKKKKKVKYILKNLLTRANEFDIITKLSTREPAGRTLKIEQHSRRTRRIKPLYSFE